MKWNDNKRTIAANEPNKVVLPSRSLADDLGAEPAGRCSSGHQRHHRLPHRSVPSGHQLLGLRQRDAAADIQVRH